MISSRFFQLVAARILGLLTSPRFALFWGEPILGLIGPRQKGKALNLSQVQRVLIVRLEEIGDVILSSPFLRELRLNLPAAWITLVVKPSVYNLVELCPYVDQVLTCNLTISDPFPALRLHGRVLHFALKNLWRSRFDLVVVPRWDPDVCRASFLAYFSGAPWRVGYSEQVNLFKQSANPGWDCLYTHLLHETSVKHEVEVNLDIIRFLGGEVQRDRLEMWLNPEDETFADQLLASHRYPSGAPLIAFGLGAGDSKRIWPLSKFIQLGAWLKKAYGAYILALGGKSDESLGWQLYKYLPDAVANLSGRTTLRQAGALLKRCTLFVGNDSGPMHLAAAAGVPVVEISCHPVHGLTNHPNSPQRFGPWGVPHAVLQPRTSPKSCAQACVAEKPHCILNVPVGAVQDAIRMHLAHQGTR